MIFSLAIIGTTALPTLKFLKLIHHEFDKLKRTSYKNSYTRDLIDKCIKLLSNKILSSKALFVYIKYSSSKRLGNVSTIIEEIFSSNTDTVLYVLSWTSSERFMYVQFASRVYRDRNKSYNKSKPPHFNLRLSYFPALLINFSLMTVILEKLSFQKRNMWTRGNSGPHYELKGMLTLSLKSIFWSTIIRLALTVPPFSLPNIMTLKLRQWRVFSLHKKWKFSFKDFFSKCDQICRKLRIWSHLLQKSLIENFIFVQCLINRDHPPLNNSRQT